MAEASIAPTRRQGGAILVSESDTCLVVVAVFKTVCRGLVASRVGSIPTRSRQRCPHLLVIP